MKYNEDDKKRWLKLYLQSKSFREISLMVNVPFSTISWNIRQLNQIDGRKAGRKKIYPDLTKEEIEQNRIKRAKSSPCSQCGKINDERYDSAPNRCKECIGSKVKDYYLNNKDQIVERSRKYYQDNKGQILANEKLKYDPIESREYGLNKKFGITIAIYEEMLKNQNGGCAICGKPPLKKALAVDHCHITGKNRELLCTNCNQAIGHAKDNPELLDKM